MPWDELPPQQSLTDRVYETIRRSILSNEVLPGERLSVPELAHHLGVSRSPVREAIVRLEREGLARSVANKGAVVAPLGQRDLSELYEVREALEGYASRLAASRLSDAEISALSDIVARHRSVVARGDLEAHVRTDVEFHQRIRDGSRNQSLIELHETLGARIRVALHSTASRPGNPQQAVAEHEEILDALSARDPDLAEQRARKHVQRVRQSLTEAQEGAELASD